MNIYDSFRGLFTKPYHLLFRDIKRIFALLPGRLRASVILLFVLMALQACMELFTIIALTHIGRALGNPAGMEQIFPYDMLFFLFPKLQLWVSENQINFILLASCVIVTFVLIKNIVTLITMHATAKVSESISLTIGIEMLERFLYSDYRWHISKDSGTALQTMMWRNNLSMLLVLQLSALTGFLTCAILFAGLIAQEPRLSLAIMGTTVLVGAFIYTSLRHRIDSMARQGAAAGAAENKAIFAATRGIRDVLIYGQQPAFLKSFSATVLEGVGPRTFLAIANTLPSLSLEVVGFALIPATITMLVQIWNATLPEIVAAVMLLMLTAWRVLPYLNRGVGQMVAIRGVRPTALPVLDFLQTLRANPTAPPPLPNPDFTFKRDIRLQNVSFTYPESTQESLHNVDLVIPHGAHVGLIGASGAGKSTLTNIISGLCPPTTGRLLVDDKELSPTDLVAFRALVGFVPQSPFLMSGTLAENVAFSQWGQPWDKVRVREACERAAIDFIDTHPAGILLPIGENGFGLSGGQAQRVSIARALYANPSVVIFDEATSALDTGNENSIVSSIERLRGDITCIIIAHRMSTVQHCDILFWFDNGKLKAQGPPSKILPLYEASYANALTA